jgi:hypothetical protein
MSAAVPPVSAKTAADRAAQVRFRRALTLMLMTVVLPGSAQLAAGNKRVGHNALRAFAAAVLFMMALVLTLLVSRDEIIQLFTNVWFLRLLRIGESDAFEQIGAHHSTTTPTRGCAVGTSLSSRHRGRSNTERDCQAGNAYNFHPSLH